MFNRKTKPLSPTDKLVLDYLKKKPDDISYIRSYNVFADKFRVNLHGNEGQIMESYWVQIQENQVISCKRD